MPDDMTVDRETFAVLLAATMRLALVLEATHNRAVAEDDSEYAERIASTMAMLTKAVASGERAFDPEQSGIVLFDVTNK